MMINPGAIVKTSLASLPWPWAFSVSGIAFILLFLQTGLDRARVGSSDLPFVALLTVAGAIYGTLGVALLALVAWALTRPFRSPCSLGWTLRAFGLCYSSALVFGVVGLAANLAMGWNTAIAFGVTGLLWALGPIVATLQEMTRGNLFLGLVLSTVCGGLLIVGWGWLGSI